MKKEISSLTFMERHLEDASEPEYETLCLQVIKDLKRLRFLEKELKND